MTEFCRDVAIDALRISPKFTSADWYKLSIRNQLDWPKAVQILGDRLRGRFLQFADDCLRRPYSGFIVLSVDCLLAESIQQFRNGVVEGRGQSQKLIVEFLTGPRFQADFDAAARKRFYTDIRCGLLHQAEAKAMWLIRRRQPAMLQVVECGPGYVLDIQRFHLAIQLSLGDYCDELVRPESLALRRALWTKMDAICSVRVARGAVYEPDLLGLDLGAAPDP